MTMIVGCAPDERGKAALHLAVMLARSSGDDLVVCVVLPAPWIPGMARVDAEYQQHLDDDADRALERARSEHSREPLVDGAQRRVRLVAGDRQVLFARQRLHERLAALTKHREREIGHVGGARYSAGATRSAM